MRSEEPRLIRVSRRCCFGLTQKAAEKSPSLHLLYKHVDEMASGTLDKERVRDPFEVIAVLMIQDRPIGCLQQLREAVELFFESASDCEIKQRVQSN